MLPLGKLSKSAASQDAPGIAPTVRLDLGDVPFRTLRRHSVCVETRPGVCSRRLAPLSLSGHADQTYVIAFASFSSVALLQGRCFVRSLLAICVLAFVVRRVARNATGLSIGNAASSLRMPWRGGLALSVVVAVAGLQELSLPHAFGDVPVFEQLPLLNSPPGAPYPGQDVQSTIGIFPATTQAVSDDFELSTSTTLTSITWWGLPLIDALVDPHFFSVIFSTNVPASGDVPSHPGDSFHIESFAAPGWGIGDNPPLYISTPVRDPGNRANMLFQYDATFTNPINLQANTIFWITIHANNFGPRELGINWGWHTRDYTIPDSLAAGDTLVGAVGGLPVNHFGASAQSQPFNSAGLAQGPPSPLNYAAGTDGPAGINAFGMDMAFALYAVPEPSTLILAALGGVALLAYRNRRSLQARA